jgi:hypothetical protein
VNLPDFTIPLVFEIELAREMVAAVNVMLPFVNSGGERVDLSAVLAHIAVQHTVAILALFQGGSLSSGYALMRPALEATYRSIWIRLVAGDREVSKAYRGRDCFPDLKKIIQDLEAEVDGTEWSAIFGKIKAHVRVLHEQVHSGGEQTVRRLKADDMRSPEYEVNRLINDVRTLAGAAMLVAIPLLTTENVETLNALMQKNYSYLSQVPVSA